MKGRDLGQWAEGLESSGSGRGQGSSWAPVAFNGEPSLRGSQASSIPSHRLPGPSSRDDWAPWGRAKEGIFPEPAQPSPGPPPHTATHTHTRLHTHGYTHTHTARLHTHGYTHIPYLPFSALLVAGELKQRDRIVELPELQRGREAGSAQPPGPLGTTWESPRGCTRTPSFW